MDKIYWSTRLLQYTGLWRPKSTTNSPLAKLLYNIYFYTICAFSHCVFMTKIVCLMKTGINSLDELRGTTYFLPELVISYHLKGLYMSFQRSKIERLVGIFEMDCCKPQDKDEVKVQRVYNKKYK